MTRLKFVPFLIVALGACSKDDPVTQPTDDVDVAVSDAEADSATDTGGGTDVGTDPDLAIPTDGGTDGGTDSGADMGTPDSALGRSGTRLRQRFLEAEGGGRIWLDWWDSELETACYFYDSTITGLRCRRDGNWTEQVAFADAACTQPVYVDLGRCGDGWAFQYQTGDFFRSTGTETTIATRYRMDPAMNCVAEAVDAADVHFVAELIPQTDFVAGTYVDEPRAGGMSARFVEGADGSRRFDSTIETTFDVTCDFFDDQTRCLPDILNGTDNLFADAACTEPVLSFQARGAMPGLVQVARQTAGCRTGFDYYVPAAPVTTVYGNTSGTCQEAPTASVNTYTRVARQVDLSEFPTATPTLLGSGPVFGEYLADANGEPVSDARWFRDGERRCYGAEVDGQDTIKCIDWVGSYNSRDYFSDAGCSTALTTTRCDATPEEVLELGERGSCRIPSLISVADVVSVGAAHTTDVYQGTPGSCTMATPTQEYTSFERGSSVLGTLPTLTVVTE